MKKSFLRSIKDPKYCAEQVSRGEERARYEGLLDIARAYNAENLERSRNMASRYYAGIDPRRRREMADGGMVREDRNGMANLPRQAIHTEYPDRFSFGQSPFIDDSVLE